MYSRPLPSEKKSEKGVCGAGGDCAQASLRRIIHSSSSSKTANNIIPVSSCFNDSEGLYRKTVFRCLVHRPHYSARLMRLGSRGPREFFSQIRHQNAFTEIAWEDAEQGLGMAMSALSSEKNRELLLRHCPQIRYFQDQNNLHPFPLAPSLIQSLGVYCFSQTAAAQHYLRGEGKATFVAVLKSQKVRKAL